MSCLDCNKETKNGKVCDACFNQKLKEALGEDKPYPTEEIEED